MRLPRLMTVREVQKVGVAALALLQLFAAAVVPTADAFLDGAGAAAPLHIESQANEDCPRLHDHVYCQLCRVLSLAGSTGTAPVHGVEVPKVAFAVTAEAEDRAGPGPLDLGPLGPRAPPLA